MQITPASGCILTALPMEIYGKVLSFVGTGFSEKVIYERTIKSLLLTSRTMKAFTYRALTFDSRFIQLAFSKPNSKGSDVMLANLPHRPYNHLRVDLRIFDSRSAFCGGTPFSLDFQNRAKMLLSLGGKPGLQLLASKIADSECTALEINRFVRLTFIRCSQLTPQFFHNIALHKQLESFEICATQIDARGIKNILANCHELTALSTRQCTDLKAIELLDANFPRKMQWFDFDDSLNITSIPTDALVHANNGFSHAILAMRTIYENPEEAKDWIKKGRKILPSLQLFPLLEREIEGTLNESEQQDLWLRIKQSGERLTAVVKICCAQLKAIPNHDEALQTLEDLHKKYPDNELVMRSLASPIVQGSLALPIVRSSFYGLNDKLKEKLSLAQELVEKLTLLNPEDDLLLGNLAWMLVQNRDSDELVEALCQKALTTNPKNRQALSCSLLLMLGDEKKCFLQQPDMIFDLCERYLSVNDFRDMEWGMVILNYFAEIAPFAHSLAHLWIAQAWGHGTNKKIKNMFETLIAKGSPNHAAQAVRAVLSCMLLGYGRVLSKTLEIKAPVLSDEDKAYFEELFACFVNEYEKRVHLSWRT